MVKRQSQRSKWPMDRVLADEAAGPDGVAVEAAAAEAYGLDPTIPTPLFHQIFLVLREKIIDGTYPYGSLLDGEQQIAAAYNVARVTAKRALDELARIGLVERQRGLGTRVVFRTAQHSVTGSVDSLLKSLRTGGQNTVKVLSFDYVAAPPLVAEMLGLTPGSEVQRATRLRSTDGRPFSLLVTYVPQDLGRTFTREDLTGQPLYALLERAGVKVASADQRFLATVADATAARLLDVELSSPLLKIVRVVKDEGERAVEYLSAMFRPDIYQYRMIMTRRAEQPGWD